MKTQKKEYEDGFIVHPFETVDGMYHASYGPGNMIKRTLKRTKTLSQAKLYLSRNNVTKALYDSPADTFEVYPVKYAKARRKRMRQKS